MEVSPLQVLFVSQGKPLVRGQFIGDMIPPGTDTIGVARMEAAKGYILWKSLASNETGIWIGGPRCWKDVEALLPEGRYLYADGTRLQSVHPPEDLQEKYDAGKSEHGAPDVPWVHWTLGKRVPTSGRW